MRQSSYVTYPGNLQILSRYSAYRVTVPFNYSNQLTTTTLNHPHYGRPKLQMSWQIDYTGSSEKTAPREINDKAAVFPWPYFDEIVITENPGFPLPLIYYYLDWFSKQTYVNSNLYGIKTTSTAGPPGEEYNEYVHTIIFNDSFDAPFEKYTVV